MPNAFNTTNSKYAYRQWIWLIYLGLCNIGVLWAIFIHINGGLLAKAQSSPIFLWWWMRLLIALLNNIWLFISLLIGSYLKLQDLLSFWVLKMVQHNQHGICANVTWHVKMSPMPFSQIQGELAWSGLWKRFLPISLSCIYKMLVACANDNKGRSIFISWMLYSSLLCQTLLIAIKTSHSRYRKCYSPLYGLVP